MHPNGMHIYVFFLLLKSSKFRKRPGFTENQAIHTFEQITLEQHKNFVFSMSDTSFIFKGLKTRCRNVLGLGPFLPPANEVGGS